MQEGWVKLHRVLSEWQWSDNPYMVALLAHFLVMANHREHKWHGVTVKPGQFITGLHSLSKRTGIPIQSLRTCLKYLKSTNEITIESTNKFSVITLLKWYQFQSKSKKLTSKSTHDPTNNQQTTNNQSTTNKNEKNVNNEKNQKPVNLEENTKRKRDSLAKVRAELIAKKIIH